MKIVKDGKLLFLSMTEILSYTKSPVKDNSPKILFPLALSESTKFNADSLNAKMREEIREMRKTLDEIEDASRSTALSTGFLAVQTAVGLIAALVLVFVR